MYLLAVWFASSKPLSGNFLDAATDPAVLAIWGLAAGTVTILQAALLLPIHRPREHDLSQPARFAHSIVVALAIAGLSWFATWALIYLLDEVFGSLSWFSAFLQRSGGLPLPLAVFGLTLVIAWSTGRHGVPALVSAIIAGAGAAALLGGLVALFWSIPRVIAGGKDNDYYLATFGSAAAAMLLGWIVGTPLVLAFMRKHGHSEGLSRWASRLFLGTTIEAAAAIPMDVMVRKKTDCYCNEATFMTLIICWAAGAFALGPVVFLVPFSRRRKRWYAGRCEVCGYDMSGCMTADRCPECGAGWKPAPEETNEELNAGC